MEKENKEKLEKIEHRFRGLETELLNNVCSLRQISKELLDIGAKSVSSEHEDEDPEISDSPEIGWGHLLNLVSKNLSCLADEMDKANMELFGMWND